MSRPIGSDSWTLGSLPGPWVRHAACGRGPANPVDLWTEPKRWIGRPPKHGRRARRPDPNAEAKAICRHCPVVAECLAHGTRNDEPGIWGGMTQTERRHHERTTR